MHPAVPALHPLYHPCEVETTNPMGGTWPMLHLGVNKFLVGCFFCSAYCYITIVGCFVQVYYLSFNKMIIESWKKTDIAREKWIPFKLQTTHFHGPPFCVDEIGSFISSNDQLSRGKKKTVRKVGQKEVQRHQLPICSTESSSKKCQSFPKEELEIEGEKPSKPFNIQVTD